MDISSTTQPKSDQLNYDDVASIAAVITVTEVRAGTAEQPVEIHTADDASFDGLPDLGFLRAHDHRTIDAEIRLCQKLSNQFGGAI